MKKLLAIVAVAAFAQSNAHAICYVNSKASAGGTGVSWDTAFNDLQLALKSTCSEIHVAAGVYKPSATGDDTASFEVRDGVKLFGGYTGTGADPDFRDPWSNLSILSGDIGNDDANALTTQIDNNTDDIVGPNSAHVLLLEGTPGVITESTVIDGFVITGGDAQGSGPLAGYSVDGVGGGMLCRGDGSGAKCNPHLENLFFSGNYARAGGALGNFGRNGGQSSPQIVNAGFHGNYAFHNGGAIVNDAASGTASPTITNATFDFNISDDYGGAIANLGPFSGQSVSTITNATFFGNQAISASVMYNSGFHDGIGASFLLSSTLFANETTDSSGSGSSIVNDGTSGFSEVDAVNTIIWDQNATGATNEVEDIQASSEFDHSILQGGCSLTAGLCTSVITSNPLLGDLRNYGGILPTLLPDATSPAIDAGTDRPVYCPVVDERGFARPQQLHCDIGAVERLATEDDIFQNSFE